MTVWTVGYDITVTFEEPPKWAKLGAGRMKWIQNPATATAEHIGAWPYCDITPGVYQVGELEGYEESDPLYYTLEGANWRAHKLSMDSGLGKLEFYEKAYGVWEMPGAGVIAIHYGGSEYRL